MRREWQLRTERTWAAEPRGPRGEALSRAARRPEPGEGPRGARPGSGGGVCRGAAPTASPSPQTPPQTPSSPAWRGGPCPVTMTTPANAQNASKTWELSLYELHRTPQVTGSFQLRLPPSRQPSPSPTTLFGAGLCLCFTFDLLKALLTTLTSFDPI